MKINKSVRDKYMELCPASSFKCDSFQEIEYKINRAVFLGKIVKTYPLQEVQYFNLRFVINKHTYEVINMMKNDEYYDVPEYRKTAYDRINDKIVV
jgi:hypothetical protein